jgi:hypothetical protein
MMRRELSDFKTEDLQKSLRVATKKINGLEMWKNKFKEIFFSGKVLIAVISVIIAMAAAAAYLSWEEDWQAPLSAGDDAAITHNFRWTGQAGDGKWSTAGNWDNGKVPDEEAEVIFDSGDKASFVDADFYGEIGSLRIDGYQGKITQERGLTIYGDYYQSSGGYQAGGEMEVKGNFIQKDGSSFDVAFGGVKVAGDFEIGEDFKISSTEDGVVLKKGDDWKTLVIDENGKRGYFATKETGAETETWSFYNATNYIKSYVSQEKGWTLSAAHGNWTYRYMFEGVDRGEKEVFKAQNAGIGAFETKVTVGRGNGIEEWYDNDFKGIEQGFTINEKPQGEGSLVLNGEIKLENLEVRKNTETAIIFAYNGTDVMEYGDLTVKDAKGDILKAKMHLLKTEGDSYDFKIAIDDAEAQYPITVDPVVVSATFSPTLLSTMDIDVANAGYGRVVSNAGDVNCDGISDFIITAFNDDTKKGTAYLHYGMAASPYINPDPAWSYHIDSTSYLGYSASAAGNVDNKECGDIIIGAPYYPYYSPNDGNEGKGRLYLFLGHAGTGLSATPDWEYTGPVSPTGQIQNSQTLGWSVSDAGDVNGDGHDDVIVGAHYYDKDWGKITNSGAAFLFLGNDTGLSSAPVWSYKADTCSEYLGWAVSSAGDVNLDGLGDVLVGAPQETWGRSLDYMEGAAYLFLGQATNTGLSATPDYTFRNPLPNPVSSYFGNSVSEGGFINDDTYPDILIGSSRYDKTTPGTSNEGALFAYYGKWDGSKVTFSPTPDWIYIGTKSGAYLGTYFTTVGDVNGDGFDDAVAGASQYTGVYSTEGSAYLFLGGKNGFKDNTFDWQIRGDNAGAQMGWSIAGAGDLNHDGASEFLVSSYKYNMNTVGGQVYLYGGVNEGSAISPEICYGGEDEDGDGAYDMADSDCKFQKSNITVAVSTSDRSEWFTDIANYDSDGDGSEDLWDAVNYPDFCYYQICDTAYPPFDPIPKPYIRDYEYMPCDRDKIYDDFHNSDAVSPVYVQPASKDFTIRVNASNPNGVSSIVIEWRNAETISTSGSEWGDITTHKYICSDAAGVNECEICVEGGDCANKVIDYESLGIPDGKDHNRLFFRVAAYDFDGNPTITGYDHDTTSLPVYDKYYRLHICSKNCHKGCVNNNPVVTLVGVTPPSGSCGGLNYKLDWDFYDEDGDGQSFYEIQLREEGSTEIMTSVQESSDTEAFLNLIFPAVSLKYNTTYQWQVRAYDDSTEEGCQGKSDWSGWSDATKSFTTPPGITIPSFTIDVENNWTPACSCSSSKIVTLTSTTSVTGIASYNWFIKEASGAENWVAAGTPVTIPFIDDLFMHEIRLEVTDDNGTCSVTQELDFGRRSPNWTEVAPPLG